MTNSTEYQFVSPSPKGSELIILAPFRAGVIRDNQFADWVSKRIVIIYFLLITCIGFAQENLEIKNIQYRGQNLLNNTIIKENMTIESASWFKRKILKKEPILFTHKLYQDDIKRLKKQYQKNGYLNVSFETPEITITKKQKIRLIIFINEGKPIKVSGVNYIVDSTESLNQVLPPREEKNIFLQSQLKVSKTFNDKTFFNDQLLIAEGFNNVGYPFATVNYDLTVDTLANTVQISWLINKGKLVRFGSTNISGNEGVPDKNIYRQLAYKQGDIWSKKKIDQTQKHIYNQGMYRVASIKAQLNDQTRDTIPIQIQIKEAPRWTVRFGGGYGREDKFRAFTDLQYLGFITKTGRLNLYGKHSGLEPYNVYLKFSQPSLFFPINTLSLYPYLQRENEPGYQLKKAGFNVSMMQNFSKELNTSIGFVYEDVQLDTTNVSSFDPDFPAESYYKKSGIVLGAIYNTAEPILDPVQGYVVSLNVKTNGMTTTREMPFYRILAEYKIYYGLRNGVILALKAKIGGIQRTDGEHFIPADERFFAGGSHSVRGWSRSNLGPKDESGRPVGGNSLLEGSAEFRISLNKTLILALFCDAGNIWSDAFSYHLKDLHYAMGTGVRIKTPIGPAGLDFARPVFENNHPWQIHFNIGHTF